MMGLLVNGAWQEDISRTKEGRFIRPAAAFRNFVTPDGSAGPSGEGGFAAEPGRYHLYISLACPWAHRTLIFRALKKLDDVISLSVTSRSTARPAGGSGNRPDRGSTPPMARRPWLRSIWWPTRATADASASRCCGTGN